VLNFGKTAVPDIQNPDPPSVAKASKGSVPNNRRECVLSTLILALIVCGVFAPWLFYGKSLYWGDICLFFLPLNSFLKDSLANGLVPLWNPYLYCGAPFVGNPQVSLLYPSTLLLPLLKAPVAIMISDVIHIFAAGVFFWLFARKGSLQLPLLPALFSAVTYMLGGFFVAKAQFPNMLASLAYVPLLLYQTELLVKSPTLRRSIIFAAVLGMQLLAAHTQITVFSLYLMVPYGLLVYFSEHNRANFFSVLAFAVFGGVVGAALACGYWLPVAQLLHSSARQVLTLRTANRFYLPWREVADLVLPHLYGSPSRGDFHAHGNYWEIDNYVGVAVVGLAIITLVKLVLGKLPRPIIIQTTFWLIVFIISVWAATGSQGRLYPILFRFLPLLKAFHDPGRLMLGANIAIALFAGAGLKELQSWLPPSRQTPVALLVLLLAVVSMGWHDRGIYPLKLVSAIEGMTKAPIPEYLSRSDNRAVGPRILMVDSAGSWQSFTTYKTYEEHDSNFVTQWPDTLCPDLGMTYRIPEAGGYDPEFRRDSQEMIDLAEQPFKSAKQKSTSIQTMNASNVSPYLACLGIKYLIAYRVRDVHFTGMRPVIRSTWRRHDRRVTVYQNLDYVGRAEAFRRWTSVSSQKQAFDSLDQMLASPYAPSLFDRPVIEQATMSPGTDVSFSGPAELPVTFISDDPDRVRLTVPSSTGSTMLVLRDTFHPGWQATVNGRPFVVLRANVNQRSVIIPGSRNIKPDVIVFRYRPEVFLFGFYVSLVSLSFILAILIGKTDRQIVPDP
jgi:hypothetical protein